MVPRWTWIFSHWTYKYVLPLNAQAYSFPNAPISVLRHSDAKLRIFHCTYNTDRQLLSFLVKQDDIRDLAITADPIMDLTVFFELSEIFLLMSLPHLSEISASLCFLRTLVPGRPVHTVRLKSYHSQIGHHKWGLDDIVDHSTVPIKNLVLDLTIWHLPVLHSLALLPKHVEETTLTGFSAGVSRTHSYS